MPGSLLALGMRGRTPDGADVIPMLLAAMLPTTSRRSRRSPTSSRTR